jgi:hypothetical protein
MLMSKITAVRKKFVSEDVAKTGFITNFLNFGGLSDYYERLVAVDPCQKNLEALDVLKKPID